VSRRVRIILTKGYHLYLDNREFSVEDGLSYWREKIFNGLMLVFIIFGSIAMIPNIIASIDANAHLITFTNIIIYVAILFIFYNRSIPLKIKI